MIILWVYLPYEQTLILIFHSYLSWELFCSLESGWCGCLGVKAYSKPWIDNLCISMASFYCEKSSKDTKHGMYRLAQRKCKCPCGLSISWPSGKSSGTTMLRTHYKVPHTTEFWYGSCEMCLKCHQCSF